MIRHLWGAVLTLFFTAALVTPIILFVTGEKGPAILAAETRAAATLPPLPKSADAFRSFPEKYEAYFNDSFPLREKVIATRATIMFHLLGLPATINLIIGKEGWLYYRANNAINSYRRFHPYSELEKRMLALYLGDLNRWLNKQGIGFALLLPPNKSTIYPEYMPDRYSRADLPSYIDDLVAIGKAESFPVIDPRKKLIEAKKADSVYHRLDIHWNLFGAYVAYQELSETMEGVSVPFTPIPDSAITFSKKPAIFQGGDLGLFSQIAWLNPKLDPYPVFKVNSTITRINDPSLPEYPRSFRQRNSDHNLPSLLIYRDSFTTNLELYLNHHFSDMTFIWSYSVTKSMIDKEKPEMVIVQILERFLGDLPKLLVSMNEIIRETRGIIFTFRSPRTTGKNNDDLSAILAVSRCATAPDRAGYLSFGPYEVLKRGEYQATFRLKQSGAPDKQVGKIDVSGQKGTIVLASEIIEGKDDGQSGKWFDMTLKFEITKPEVSDIEYRVEYFGEGDICIDYVKVVQL